MTPLGWATIAVITAIGVDATIRVNLPIWKVIWAHRRQVWGRIRGR